MFWQPFVRLVDEITAEQELYRTHRVKKASEADVVIISTYLRDSIAKRSEQKLELSERF